MHVNNELQINVRIIIQHRLMSSVSILGQESIHVITFTALHDEGIYSFV